MANLNTDDPALAVVIDRLERLSTDFKEHSVHVNARMDGMEKSFDKKFDELQKPVSRMNTVIDKAQGGYLVILGLGAMLGYVTGLWDKLLRIFHG